MSDVGPSILRRYADAVMAIELLVEECVKSVEYGDWPELQECVKRARQVIEESRA